MPQDDTDVTPDVIPDVISNMTPDVSQWLAEVQLLQHQIVELRQERDRAYASADNLRQLCDAEARQRRRESDAYTRKIGQLQKALAEFQAPQLKDPGQLNVEIGRIRDNRSVEQLQTQLVAAKRQCEQLKFLLKAEQKAHEKTRQNLTAALGDTVDLLAKERAAEERAMKEQPDRVNTRGETVTGS